jgi:hypothetical protein
MKDWPPTGAWHQVPQQEPIALSTESDDEDTARVPQITKLPEGIEVVEHNVGTATGQWILQVRCQCGRRWYELKAVEMATCPRCGVLVYVAVEPGGP